jgi:hypothetical protein
MTIKVTYSRGDDGEYTRSGDNISDATRAVYTKFFNEGEVVYQNFGPKQRDILARSKAVNMEFDVAFGEALKSMIDPAILTPTDKENFALAMWFQIGTLVYLSDQFLFKQFKW